VNGLDRLQRAIGALPITRQGRPITTAAPTRCESNDRQGYTGDRPDPDHIRGLSKRQTALREAVIGLIGWFWETKDVVEISTPPRLEHEESLVVSSCQVTVLQSSLKRR
jgi:hypothetical protein